MNSGRQAKGNDLEAIRLEAARALCKAVEAEIRVVFFFSLMMLLPVYLYVYMYIFIYACAHIWTYIYRYMNKHTHTHIYIYIYVYTHTIIQNYGNEQMRNSAVPSRWTIPEKTKITRRIGSYFHIFFFGRCLETPNLVWQGFVEKTIANRKVRNTYDRVMIWCLFRGDTSISDP